MALSMKIFALATVAAATLAACGGGSESSGSNSGATPATRSIQGDALKGPMIDALVSAYKVESGKKSSTPFATTRTSDKGSYSLDIGQYNGPICVEVTGKKMLDDNDLSQIIDLAEDLTLTSCAPAGSQTVGVNPFTDLAAKSIDLNSFTEDSIIKANNAASLIAGSDPLNAAFDSLKPKLASIWGDANFSCGTTSKELCGLVNLSNAYAQTIANYVKTADSQALKNDLADNSKNAPVKPDQDSESWKDFGVIKDNDPRYGNGGTVIPKGTAFPLKDVPPGVTPVEAGYFLFEITDPQKFATAQFYTAGKISQGDGKEGYDFTRFSVETSDNWQTAKWSEVRFGKEFNDGNVLVTCQAPTVAGNMVGSEQTIVAISEKAKVVNDYKFAYGKTLVEYSCGVDQEDWNDFISNGKSPFDFTWETKIGADGKVVVDDNGKTVSVEDLFSKDGYREIGDNDGTDYETYATAYELNGEYYVLFKDRDEERDGNSSRYGVALGVFK